MNRTVLFSACLFFGGMCFGQTLTPVVTASGGGYQQSERAALSYTIGEAAIETLISKNAILTQGFHQTYFTTTAISDLRPDLKLELFPNPTVGWLSVKVPEEKTGLSVLLMDSHGSALVKYNQVGGSTIQLDLTQYPSGVYFLRALTEDHTAVKTFKIVKVQ